MEAFFRDRGAGGGPLEAMETLLDEVEAVTGAKQSIVMVQKKLDAMGQRGLCRRVEKLARGRRVAAHPDVHLAEAVAGAFMSDVKDGMGYCLGSGSESGSASDCSTGGKAALMGLVRRVNEMEAKLRKIEDLLVPDALGVWLADLPMACNIGATVAVGSVKADAADTGIVSDTGERPCSLAVGVAWADVVDSDSGLEPDDAAGSSAGWKNTRGVSAKKPAPACEDSDLRAGGLDSGGASPLVSSGSISLSECSAEENAWPGLGAETEELIVESLELHALSREGLQRVADLLGIQLNCLCHFRQVFNSIFELWALARGGYIAVFDLDELLLKINDKLGEVEFEQAVRELDQSGSGVIAFSGFGRWFCNVENTIGLTALPARSKKSRRKARKKAASVSVPVV